MKRDSCRVFASIFSMELIDNIGQTTYIVCRYGWTKAWEMRFLALFDDVFDRVTYVRIAVFFWTFWASSCNVHWIRDVHRRDSQGICTRLFSWWDVDQSREREGWNDYSPMYALPLALGEVHRLFPLDGVGLNLIQCLLAYSLHLRCKFRSMPPWRGIDDQCKVIGEQMSMRGWRNTLSQFTVKGET